MDPNSANTGRVCSLSLRPDLLRGCAVSGHGSPAHSYSETQRPPAARSLGSGAPLPRPLAGDLQQDQGRQVLAQSGSGTMLCPPTGPGT